LALVAAYARRGIHLPMILDDVFVNFDAGRTKIACAVLRDFARQGHQLLVFTCHEHVWRMFQELKVDTRRIPNRLGEPEAVEPLPEPAPEPLPEPKALPVPEPIAVLPQPEETKPIVVEPISIPPIAKVPDVAPEPAMVTYGQMPVVTEVEYWWDAEALPKANSEAELAEEQYYDWSLGAGTVTKLAKRSSTRSGEE
jgi:hypothetical protein